MSGAVRGKCNAGQPAEHPVSQPDAQRAALRTSPEQAAPFGATSEFIDRKVDASSIRRTIRGARTPFSRFWHAWRQQTGTSRKTAGALFPCAPPPVIRRSRPKSSRRAARWRRHHAVDLHVELILGMGSFLALGGKSGCPRGLARPDTEAHVSAIAHIRKQVCRFVRLMAPATWLSAIGSGRRGPALQASVAQLSSWAASSSRGAAGYWPDAPRPFSPQVVAGEPGGAQERFVSFDGEVRGSPYHSGKEHAQRYKRYVKEAEEAIAFSQMTTRSSTEVLRIDPERIALPKQDRPAFSLGEWLPPEVAATYDDPELLKIPGAVTSLSRVHASREAWLRFLKRLDAAGMLVLAAPDELPVDARGKPARNGFFAVVKDPDADRSICSRIPRNRLERRLRLCGELLPHGCQFCEMQLARDETLHIETDDVDNYYHRCGVSLQRALSNAIGPCLAVENFEGTRALAAARERLGSRVAEPRRLQACLGALPMGDGNAVCYGELAHVNLLRAHHALPDSDFLRYRAAPPRSSTWSGVVVDDHATARKVKKGSSYEPSSELECAHRAYAAAGLEPKQAKAVRGAESAEFWGTRLDGRAGRVRARDDIVQRACGLTLALLTLGASTEALWLAVLGLWTHVLLFRRVGFGLLQSVFACASASGSAGDTGHPDDASDCRGPAISHTPADAHDELVSLLILAPLLESDIRAPVSGCLTASDASPWAAAAVETDISGVAASELWRYRDRRGGYVRCETELEGIIREIAEDGTERDRSILAAVLQNAANGDCDAEAGDPFAAATAHEARFSWVSELADALGWRLSFKYKLRLADHINLKELKAYKTVVRRAAARASEHGTRRLVLLDSAVVRGAAAKGRSSSRRLNKVLRSIVCDQLAANLVFGSLPVPTRFNPSDDPTRDRRVRKRAARAYPGWLAGLDAGDYGPWDRRYGASQREVPAGVFHEGTRVPVSRPGPCAAELRDFDSTLGFPGEGPPRVARPGVIERRQGVDIRGPRASAEEQGHRQAAIRDFESWLVTLGVASERFWRFESSDVVALLVEYGQFCFRSGKSQASYKNALLGATDRRDNLRPAMKPAWNALTKWENTEPGGNHNPLPRAAHEAGLSVSIVWQWREFTAAQVTGWCTLSRPGGLLKLRRCDLVLPSDQALSSGPAFVKFEPKGRWGRNAPRVEHVRIADRVAVEFLEAYAGGMAREEWLFPTFAASGNEGRYRAEWDAVFGSLGFVCKDKVGITPASLRAGAATAHYAATGDPQQLRWLLRHQDDSTCRRYIQEHAAALSMVELAPRRREAVRALASLAPILLHAEILATRNAAR